MNSPYPSHQWRTDSEISMQRVTDCRSCALLYRVGGIFAYLTPTAHIQLICYMSFQPVDFMSWSASVNLFKSTRVKMNTKPGGFDFWLTTGLGALMTDSMVHSPLYPSLCIVDTARWSNTPHGGHAEHLSWILPQHTCFLLVQILPNSSYLDINCFLSPSYPRGSNCNFLINNELLFVTTGYVWGWFLGWGTTSTTPSMLINHKHTALEHGNTFSGANPS